MPAAGRSDTSNSMASLNRERRRSPLAASTAWVLRTSRARSHRPGIVNTTSGCKSPTGCSDLPSLNSYTRSWISTNSVLRVPHTSATTSTAPPGSQSWRRSARRSRTKACRSVIGCGLQFPSSTSCWKCQAFDSPMWAWSARPHPWQTQPHSLPRWMAGSKSRIWVHWPLRRPYTNCAGIYVPCLRRAARRQHRLGK